MKISPTCHGKAVGQSNRPKIYCSIGSEVIVQRHSRDYLSSKDTNLLIRRQTHIRETTEAQQTQFWTLAVRDLHRDRSTANLRSPLRFG